MNTSSRGKIERLDIVKDYFERSDAGRFPADLFTSDFEFYVPKFGIGRGLKDFFELAEAMLARRVHSFHHRDTLQFIDAGNKIVVEGTTEGLGRDNVRWCGGETPGGRFCNVFEFNDDDLIKRMYIYLDPDFTSADKDRFLWPERSQTEW